MDKEIREALDRIEGRITGLGLRLDGIRHDLNASSSSHQRKEAMNTEPVALTAAIAVVLFNVANALGVVVDLPTVQALVISVGAVVTALVARSKVTPV